MAAYHSRRQARASALWAVAALLVTFLAAGARADVSSSKEDLLTGIGQVLMKSFKTSSVDQIHSAFVSFLAKVSSQGAATLAGLETSSSSLLNKSVSDYLAKLPGLTGMNLTNAVKDHCNGFEFTRGGVIPAALLGPVLNVTLDTGRCELHVSDDLKSHSVLCDGPSVSYIKTPAKLVHKHLSADRVDFPNCGLRKEFGQVGDTILLSAGELIHYPTFEAFGAALQAGALKLIGISANDTQVVVGGTATVGSGSTPSSPAALPFGWTVVQA